MRSANDIYRPLVFGVTMFTEGDGVVQNMKIANNQFTDIVTPITGNGETTKQAVN